MKCMIWDMYFSNGADTKTRSLVGADTVSISSIDTSLVESGKDQEARMVTRVSLQPTLQFAHQILL